MKLCLSCFEQYADELNTCPHCGFEEDTPPENAMHITPGTILLDRYIIGKVIGYGGFGVTYAAYDPLLEMKVAIKEYLPSEFATRVIGQTQVTVFGGDKAEQFADGMHKFVDEAKKLAKFQSTPGVVRIFDSFECNNTAYIVMELLEGETLSEKLKREGKISVDDAIKMMTPVIQSLDEVHKDGIIHRDIAPDNIFITKDGQVKLIDFGAARYATTTHSRSLTVVIKPGYSPEEQYRSRGDQGKHTDVYAVAATMYRMITGEAPPDALERRAYFENKKKDILKPISEFVPDIEKNKETAILNALNVRVEDRTPDMQTLMSELTSVDKVRRRDGKIKPLDMYTWPKWAKIGVPVIGAALVVFFVLFFTGVIGFDAKLKSDIYIPEGQTRVPSVINNDYDKALRRLTEAKLIMAISGKEYSDMIPVNYVLTQDVNPGLVVDENTVVHLKLSAGKMTRTVPDVRGFEYEKAKALLESLKFVVSKKEDYSESIAEGCVISQSSSPGAEIERGTSIELTVSKGYDPAKKPANTSIPDLKGKRYDEVIEAAQNGGFNIKVTERRFDRTAPKDTVIEQKNNGGTAELVISKGFEKITVPDITFESEEEAKAVLEALGLTIKREEEYDDNTEAGIVIKQSIALGEQADPGTEITITVSKGAAPFEMINVVGKQQEDAEKLLKEKGLSVSVEFKKDNAQTKGKVLEQSVKAGTTVKRGDSVTLTVCSHNETVKVPDLAGKTKAEAEKALKQVGLKATFSEAYDEKIEAGKVISQNPKSGANAKDGSTVTVNISKGKDPAKSVPTEPVGTGYVDYTFQDLNNDGEKELIEVYERMLTDGQTTVAVNSVVYRIYETTEKYREIEFKPTYIVQTRDIIVYNGNAGRVQVWAESNGVETIHGFLFLDPESSNCNIISAYHHGDTQYPTSEYYRGANNNAISRSEYLSYMKNVTYLYGHLETKEHFEQSKNYQEPASQRGNQATENTATSGKCGENVSWTLDSNGLLTISGSGRMYDYDAFFNNKSPFTNNELINQAVIENGVTSIGKHAFFSCGSLASISIPDGITSIGYGAFRYCTKLTSIAIPDSVTSMDGEVFCDCPSLTNITISNSVTSIGVSAFISCRSLTRVIIPNSVTSIGNFAFDNCASLTSVTIPNSVIWIGREAFDWCKSLTSVTIPNSVTSIGDKAFGYCYGDGGDKKVPGFTIKGKANSAAERYASNNGFTFIPI
ncbi:PASTA domain, binds beta-lactams [Ruminococcaceae bacterium FB2012]|nr:PASTA domain, binds beta-lactams [Ruminococcaceae bacterium FB2012]